RLRAPPCDQQRSHRAVDAAAHGHERAALDRGKGAGASGAAECAVQGIGGERDADQISAGSATGCPREGALGRATSSERAFQVVDQLLGAGVHSSECTAQEWRASLMACSIVTASCTPVSTVVWPCLLITSSVGV